MKLITATDLKALVEQEAYPSISIYLPTHVTGSERREDPIRFRNLLNKCQNALEGRCSPRKAAELLEPGFELVNNTMFWKDVSHSLAIFMSPDFSDYFQLSARPEEKFHIGKFFHILPLVTMAANNRSFYILLLSQKKIKFFKATGSSVNEVALRNVPKSIEEILQFDVVEEHIGVHSAPAGKSAGNAAIYHGVGSVPDDSMRKKNVDRYFKEVAKRIDRQFSEDNTPMVLAGVEYDLATYRENSTYRNLVSDGISVNIGDFDVKEVHRDAYEIVKPYFDRDIEKTLGRYQNLIGTVKSSADMDEILPAAYDGRVDTLLVDITKHISGAFDAESKEVRKEPSEEGGNENLLNLAAIYSLRNDGKVCPIASEKLEGDLAAVFRY